MADEVVYAQYDGYISSIKKEADGFWTVIMQDAQGNTVIISGLFEVYVLPCKGILAGQRIGKRTRGGDGGSISLEIVPVPEMTVDPDPVTHSGKVTFSWKDVAAGLALMGPVSGAPGSPSFRKIQFSDIGLPVLEIAFSVGSPGSPPIGASSFVIADDQGQPILNKKLWFVREGEFQYSPRHYTYDDATGDTTITVAFEDQEDCLIWLFPKEMFVSIDSQQPIMVSEGFPYSLPIIF